MARRRKQPEQSNGMVKWRHLSIGTWIAIGGFGLTLVGTTGTVLARYFATTEQVAVLETKAAVEEAHDQHTDWQVQVLWVEQQNTKAKVDRTDKNIDRVMVKMGLDPPPDAQQLPVPPPPPTHAATPR